MRGGTRKFRRSASTSPARRTSSRKSAGIGASTGFRPRSRPCGAGRGQSPPPSSAIAGCGTSFAAPGCRKPGHSRSSSEPPRCRSSATARHRWRSPTRCPRNSPSCGRRCCRVCSTRWSTAVAGRRPTSGSSRRARSSAPLESRRDWAGCWRARVKSTGADKAAGWTSSTPKAWPSSSAVPTAVELTAEPTEAYSWFVRGRSAEVICTQDGQRIVVGAIGQLQRQLVADRGLSSTDAVYGGELDLGALDRAAGQPAASRITPLPRFPSIVRDLSILIDERLPAAQVRGTIRAIAPKILVSVREFDRYQGAGVAAGQISLSVRLTFRDPDPDADRQRGPTRRRRHCRRAVVRARRDAAGANDRTPRRHSH